MRAFITGSAGFIGIELVDELSDHDITTFDLVDGEDIRDYDEVKEAMKGCDVVFHLAALRKPYEDKSWEDYFRTNCGGTFNVAQAAAECGVERFIYTSSTSYYGVEEGIPYVRPVKESNPVMTQHADVEELSCRNCDVAYSTSKVIAEQVLANYGMTKQMQVIMLRLGPTRARGEYRPFEDLDFHLRIENALDALVKAAKTEKELWYEAFTICDDIDSIDISKAKRILNYNPR